MNRDKFATCAEIFSRVQYNQVPKMRIVQRGDILVEVYYYLPADETANAVECGLKMSKWYDKEVVINNENKKCISAFLNPKDDIEKYRSSGFRCVKLELAPNYCFIADKYLYLAGLDNSEVMSLYLDSIIPVESYIFGSYRIPECLVTCTVIGGHITVLNKRLDSPVLFDNSEDLYINNIIESYKEEYDDFSDTVLYSFYCKLAEMKKIDKIEDMDHKIAVFLNRNTGKAYTIKIPDMEKY